MRMKKFIYTVAIAVAVTVLFTGYGTSKSEASEYAKCFGGGLYGALN